MHKVSIIIITCNHGDSITKTLDSPASCNREKIEVLCIDNGSVDNTVENINQFKNLRLICNRENTGFSAACNQGIANTSGDHILFLNPDAVLVDDALTQMTALLENAPPDVAGVGPKLVRSAKGPDGKRIIDSAGISLNRENLSPFDLGRGQIDIGQFDRLEDYFGPSGACALYRRVALLDLAVEGEIFDNDFFAYYEDVDLAWRARLFGYRFLYAPGARVVHDRKNPESKSTDVQAMAFVNRYFCAIKNDIRIKDHFPKTVAVEIARLGWRMLEQPGFSVALSHLQRHFKGMRQKRRLILHRHGVVSQTGKLQGIEN